MYYILYWLVKWIKKYKKKKCKNYNSGIEKNGLTIRTTLPVGEPIGTYHFSLAQKERTPIQVIGLKKIV